MDTHKKYLIAVLSCGCVLNGYTPACGMTKEAFRLWYAERYAKMSKAKLQAIFNRNH